MKSQNVLLTRNWDIAKIADVGVARFAKAVDVAGNEDLASALSLHILPKRGLAIGMHKRCHAVLQRQNKNLNTWSVSMPRGVRPFQNGECSDALPVTVDKPVGVPVLLRGLLQG